MRYLLNILTISLVFLFFLSCTGKKGENAKTYLEEANMAYEAENFSLAKLKIDSIKHLFPKSYNEIDSGFKLMQKIRRAENIRNISFCDSMLQENYTLLHTYLSNFDYVRDTRYQEFGEYYPKVYPHQTSLQRNGLRSGVSEKGQLFIESILVGASIKHNRIKITSNDGSFAESGRVTDDGLNYRFSTSANNFEIVRFIGTDENGMAGYIHSYYNHPLTVYFYGNRTIKITLSSNAKKGIYQSYELSNLLLDIERLKFEKERSEALIRYLDSRNNASRTTTRE